MKVCECEVNMADKIVDYCKREIASKEMTGNSLLSKQEKLIEEAGITTLKRVINRISYITDKNYSFNEGG